MGRVYFTRGEPIRPAVPDPDAAPQLVGTVFPDAEILSAGFHTLAQAKGKVKPLLADRVTAALVAVEQGVTVLCEQGQRIA